MIWDNPSDRAALDVTGPLGTRVADTILVCGPVWPCEQTGHTNRIAPFTPPKSSCKPGAVHIRGPNEHEIVQGPSMRFRSHALSYAVAEAQAVADR